MRAVLLLMLAATLARGQQLYWGPEWKTSNNTVFEQIVGVAGGHIIVLHSEHPTFKKMGYHLTLLDTATLSYQSSFPILLPDVTGITFTLREAIAANDAVVLISEGEMTNGTAQHALTLINLNSKAADTTIFIAHPEFMPGSGTFSYHFDNRRQRIQLASGGRVAGIPGLWVEFLEFDMDLQQMLNESFTLTDFSFGGGIQMVTSDDDGNIAALLSKTGAIRQPPSRWNNDDKEAEGYGVLLLSRTEKRLKELDLRIGDRQILGITLRGGLNNMILAAGFHTDGKARILNGAFALQLDAGTGGILSTTFGDVAPTSSELIPKKGMTKEMENYTFDHLLPLPNGRLALVAEKSFTLTSTTLDPRTNNISQSNSYYFQDILVTCIDSAGNIAWTTVHPKRQFSTNDGGIFSSYCVTWDNHSNIHITFNEKESNLMGKKRRHMSNPQVAVIADMVIDKDGKFDLDILGTNRDQPTVFQPSASYPIRPGVLITLAQKNRLARFGRLSWP
jgi:hypothetical protein